MAETTWTPTDEMVEAAIQAEYEHDLAGTDFPNLDTYPRWTDWTSYPETQDVLRKGMRAALAAVGSMIREQVLLDAAGTMLHGNAVIASDLFIAENVPPDDAEFIACAREDVPALVREVRRLRAALREAEVMVNGVHEGVLIGGEPGAVGVMGLVAAGLRGILRRAEQTGADRG